MELYQFLFVAAFLQIFTLKTLIICAFTFLMSKHLHKKYIVNYEIKGQHKTITKICNYPIIFYNKLSSYNYQNSKSCMFVITNYNKVNYYYLLAFDEVVHMFSDLLIDVVKELMDKIPKNDKKIKDDELINNLFNSMIGMLPKKQDNIKEDKDKNKNLLNLIKKENNLSISKSNNKSLIDESDTDSDDINKFTLLDNIKLNELEDEKLFKLNNTLLKYKDTIKKEIDDISN
tara:strand:+ start:711 stop:1403 length:693 start_codon:yes stop_codon:yes gene_type:complete